MDTLTHTATHAANRRLIAAVILEFRKAIVEKIRVLYTLQAADWATSVPV